MRISRFIRVCGALTAVILLLFCCALADSEPRGYVVSTTGQVNIRDGAGTDFQVIGSVSSEGSRLPYYASIKAGGVTWYYVSWQGVYGWVSGSCFEQQAAATATPRPTYTPTPEPWSPPSATPAPLTSANEAPDASTVRGYVMSLTAGEPVRSTAGYSGKQTGTVKNAGTVLAWYAMARADSTAWYYIIDGKTKGWVSGDKFRTCLPQTTPAPDPMGYIQSKQSDLALRETAASSGKKLTAIEKSGAVLGYFADKDGWYYVLYGDTYGWVKGTNWTVVEGTGPQTTWAPGYSGATAAPAIRGYVKTTAGSVNMRIRPDKDAAKVRTLSKGKTLPWYDTREVSGQTWYQVSYQGDTGWVMGQYLKEQGTPVPAQGATATPGPGLTVTTPGPTAMVLGGGEGSLGTVTSQINNLNIRTEPSTRGDKLGTLQKGDTTEWYEKRTVGRSVWYRILVNGQEGWVLGDRLTVTTHATATPAVTPTPAATVAALTEKGTLKVTTSSVNIRQQAKADGKRIGSVKKGKTVPWYDSTVTEGETWYLVHYGRVTGWIMGKYVTPVGTTAPTATRTATPTPTASARSLTAADTGASIRGYMITTVSNVNVRSEASADAQRTGKLAKGKVVSWYATMSNSGGTWYYISSGDVQGWVRGDFLTPMSTQAPTATPTATPTAAPTAAPVLTPTPAPDTEDGILADATDRLLGWYRTLVVTNVRKDTSVTSQRLGSLRANTKVSVWREKKVNGDKWYYIHADSLQGWVLASLLTPVSTATATARMTATPRPTATPRLGKSLGMVSSSATVTMRSGAGISSSRVGSLPANTRVYYFASQPVGSVTWYYINYNGTLGWVSGAYARPVTAGTATPKPTATPGTSRVLGYGTTTTRAAIRGGAGTQYAQLSTAASGSRLPYYATQRSGSVTWYYVKYSGGYGWISGVCFALPTPTPTPRATATPRPSNAPLVVTDGSYSMNIYPAEKIDWWKGGIQSLYRKGMTAMVYDVKTRHIWRAWRWSGGNHADIEPATAYDTAVLCKIYGVRTADEIEARNMWQRRPCLITIGTHTYACSLYGIPHGTNTIKNNNMDGQVCLHFTNSRTHCGDEVDSYHQAAIQYAWTHAPNGHK